MPGRGRNVTKESETAAAVTRRVPPRQGAPRPGTMARHASEPGPRRRCGGLPLGPAPGPGPPGGVPAAASRSLPRAWSWDQLAADGRDLSRGSGSGTSGCREGDRSCASRIWPVRLEPPSLQAVGQVTLTGRLLHHSRRQGPGLAIAAAAGRGAARPDKDLTALGPAKASVRFSWRRGSRASSRCAR